MPLDMNLYKPTALELKIEQYYKEHGILAPIDLTIRNVSHAFDVDVEYYDGKPFADWIGPRGIVVLNQKYALPDQRADFFHEVGHCVLHVGDQSTLPSLFVDLQEAQSLRFQYYAALPYFMIANIAYESYSSLLQTLSQSFVLPTSFIQQRVKQISNRIQQARWDMEFKLKLMPKIEPVAVSYHDYCDETKRILGQLHSQIAKRKTQCQ
jgi:hypothetical protein